jgi:hypothetical protein
MEFLLVVLAVQFILKAIVNKSKKINTDVDKTETRDVKHPAEFMLRQND